MSVDIIPGPGGEGARYAMVFDEVDGPVVFAAVREEVAQRPADRLELDKFERKCAVRFEGPAEVIADKVKGFNQVKGYLQFFHERTPRAVEEILAKTNSFENDAFVRRHLLGQRAGELVVDIESQVGIIQTDEFLREGGEDHGSQDS